MEVIIAGGGRQGRAAAYKLKEWGIPCRLVDPNGKRVEALKREGFDAAEGDVLSLGRGYFEGASLLISAVPARLGEGVHRLALRQGVDLVDISYTEFDPFTLEERVREAGIRVIFDAGLAPGLSNLLVGELAEGIERVERIKILVGGIPERNIPPLGYTITWSVEDLVEEYTRPARIVRNGRLIQVEPLSGVEEVLLEGMEPLEAFYTDGLRSLLRTFSHVPNMEEKTIRYPGHAEKMRFLLDLGLFSRERCVKGELRPYDVGICLLQEALKGDGGDVVILQVEVEGGGVRRRARIFERAEGGFTAMERTVVFTCAAFARILLEEEVEPGLYAPEMLHRYAERIFEMVGVEVLRGERYGCAEGHRGEKAGEEGF